MARNIYKVNGKRVPSVTTVLGLLSKPALVYWANKLGLEGIEVKNFVDDKASIGTLTHSMVESYCTGKPIDFSSYTLEQRITAETAYQKWIDFIKDKKFKAIENELMLTSLKHVYGGQIDIYAKLEGKFTLIDIKTSNATYFEHYLQLAAYSLLLVENGYKVEKIMIVRIGRDEGEGFEIKEFVSGQRRMLGKIFLYLLKIYNLKKDPLIKELTTYKKKVK